jgi:hypothetical protein
VPKAADIADRNRQLLENCQQDEHRLIAGREQTVGAGMVIEREHLLPLASEGADLAQTSFPTVNGLGCVKVLTNTYSVPLPAGAQVQAKAYASSIELWHGGRCEARHERCYRRQQQILDLEHYLDIAITGGTRRRKTIGISTRSLWGSSSTYKSDLVSRLPQRPSNAGAYLCIFLGVCGLLLALFVVSNAKGAEGFAIAVGVVSVLLLLVGIGARKSPDQSAIAEAGWDRGWMCARCGQWEPSEGTSLMLTMYFELGADMAGCLHSPRRPHVSIGLGEHIGLLAARRLGQWDGKRSPALECAIADAISLAERIMARIDSRWPVESISEPKKKPR